MSSTEEPLESISCGRCHREEVHGPHVWHLQASDDSPEVIGAQCPGYAAPEPVELEGEPPRCFTTKCENPPTTPHPHPKAAPGTMWCDSCRDRHRFHYGLENGDVVIDKSTGERFQVKHSARDTEHFGFVFSADDIVLFKSTDPHAWSGGISRVCGLMTEEQFEVTQPVSHAERAYAALVTPLNPEGWRDMDDPDEKRRAQDEWDEHVAHAFLVDAADAPEGSEDYDWDSASDWPGSFGATMLGAVRLDRITRERDETRAELERLRTAQREFAEQLLAGEMPGWVR